jgi:prepilin-type N-terminal cleavage/methylation domain-containing protein
MQASGFTLIEVMVVVVILGLLSSIAVISVTGAQKTARVGACKTEFAAAAAALSAYKNDTNTSSATTISDLINKGYLVPPINMPQGYTISVNDSEIAVTVTGGSAISSPVECNNIS